jgi:hypothetical protein
LSTLDATFNPASVCCERCGTVLEIFEEHDDGVIYLACGCMTEADRMRANQAHELAVGAVADLALPLCSRCSQPLLAFHTRADGKPGYLACTCAALPDFRPSGKHARFSGSSRPPFARTEAVSHAPQVARGAGMRRVGMIGAGVVVLAAALAGLRVQGPTGSRGRDALAAAEIEMRKDASGALTLVSGADPSAVLIALCAHPQFKSSLVPGTVSLLVPPDPDLLLGSAFLRDGASTQRQVMLKRDPLTKRWSIGDGRNAIVPARPSATLIPAVPAGKRK